MTDKSSLASWFKGAFSQAGDRASDYLFEVRIDREIHLTQEKLRQARERVSSARAEKIVARKKVEDIRSTIDRLEQETVVLIAAKKTAKAKVLCKKIVELQVQLQEWSVKSAIAEQRELSEKSVADVFEGMLQRFKRQLDLRRAARSIQRSQEAIVVFGEDVSVGEEKKSFSMVEPETAKEIMERLGVKAEKSIKSTVKKSKAKTDIKNPKSKRISQESKK